MNIFIPDHLKKINIINQLNSMLVEYSTATNSDGSLKYYSNYVSSFDDYNYYQKSDPVKRFINLDFSILDDKGKSKKDYIEESGQDYESIVNYITTVFYSVKGTKEVINLMKKHFHIESVIYSIESCEVILSSDFALNDSSLYSESLENFCNALLYFRDYKSNSSSITLKIEAVSINNVQTVHNSDNTRYIDSYKEFKVDGTLSNDN